MLDLSGRGYINCLVLHEQYLPPPPSALSPAPIPASTLLIPTSAAVAAAAAASGDGNDPTTATSATDLATRGRLLASSYPWSLLILQSNMITDLTGIHLCTRLRKLDVSRNAIVTLPNANFWAALPRLETLLMNDNRIDSIHALQALSELKQLKIMTLYGNAVEFHPSYRHLLVNTLPSLILLDFYVVSDQELIEGAQFGPIYGTFSRNLECVLPRYAALPHLDQLSVSTFELRHVARLRSRYSPVIRIQSWWRGVLVRRALAAYRGAATTIQRAFRRFSMRKEARAMANPKAAAAIFGLSVTTANANANNTTSVAMSADNVVVATPQHQQQQQLQQYESALGGYGNNIVANGAYTGPGSKGGLSKATVDNIRSRTIYLVAHSPVAVQIFNQIVRKVELSQGFSAAPLRDAGLVLLSQPNTLDDTPLVRKDILRAFTISPPVSKREQRQQLRAQAQSQSTGAQTQSLGWDPTRPLTAHGHPSPALHYSHLHLPPAVRIRPGPLCPPSLAQSLQHTHTRPLGRSVPAPAALAAEAVAAVAAQYNGYLALADAVAATGDAGLDIRVRVGGPSGYCPGPLVDPLTGASCAGSQSLAQNTAAVAAAATAGNTHQQQQQHFEPHYQHPLSSYITGAKSKNKSKSVLDDNVADDSNASEAALLAAFRLRLARAARATMPAHRPRLLRLTSPTSRFHEALVRTLYRFNADVAQKNPKSADLGENNTQGSANSTILHFMCLFISKYIAYYWIRCQYVSIP